MKRITSLALSAALLASLSTPVLAAPAISVDAAPTAAVLEEENSLWELPQADTPDMSNTVWSFAGGLHRRRRDDSGRDGRVSGGIRRYAAVHL